MRFATFCNNQIFIVELCKKESESVQVTFMVGQVKLDAYLSLDHPDCIRLWSTLSFSLTLDLHNQGVSCNTARKYNERHSTRVIT